MAPSKSTKKGSRLLSNTRKRVRALVRAEKHVQLYLKKSAQLGERPTRMEGHWLFLRGKLPAELKRVHRKNLFFKLRPKYVQRMTEEIIQSGVPKSIYMGASQSDVSVAEFVGTQIVRSIGELQRDNPHPIKLAPRTYFSREGKLLGTFHLELIGRRYKLIFRFESPKVLSILRKDFKQSERRNTRGLYVVVHGALSEKLLNQNKRLERGDLP